MQFGIGQSVLRVEDHRLIRGQGRFTDDIDLPGQAWLHVVRSTHANARIRRIDTSAAERMPGVVRVLTGRDVPVNLNTLLSLLDFGLDDEPILSDKKVAYMGEPVAAVIAATEAEARAAAAAISVDWEVLPHVLDVEEAIKKRSQNGEEDSGTYRGQRPKEQ